MQGLLILISLGAGFLWLWKHLEESVAIQNEETAIKLLLEAGCTVERKRIHIFRSNSGEYTLLYFDDKSNLVFDSDESFSDINDAVSKFVRKTKL